MNEAKILDRAHKAKALLDNPMYDESFEMVRLAIHDQIEKCPMADTAKAEDLRKCLKLLRDVKLNLTAALGSGQVIEFNMAREAERKKNPLRGLFR